MEGVIQPEGAPSGEKDIMIENGENNDNEDEAFDVDENDYSFEDDDLEQTWDDIDVDVNAEQQYYVPDTLNESKNESIYIDDPISDDENINNNNNNNQSVVRPNVENKSKRVECWECPQCHSNLAFSETLNFECINIGCNGKYDPQTCKLIRSNVYISKNAPLNFNNEGNEGNEGRKEKEGKNEEKKDYSKLFPNIKDKAFYEVWQCPSCDFLNAIEWKKCVNQCLFKAEYENQIEKIETQITRIKPKDPTLEIINRMENNDRNSNDIGNRSSRHDNVNLNQSNDNNWINNNNSNKNNNEKRKLKSSASFYGNELQWNGYPITNREHWKHSTENLVLKFGWPYNNAYSLFTQREFGVNVTDKTRIVMNANYTENGSLTCNERNIAINELNGWIAVLNYYKHNKFINNIACATAIPFINIYKCVGSFDYEIVCSLNVLNLFENTIEICNKNIKKYGNSDIPKTNKDIESMIPMSRLRFIGNDVFLFCCSNQGMKLFELKLTKNNDNSMNFDNNDNENEEKENDSKYEYKMRKYNEFYEAYFTEQSVMDIDVIIGKDESDYDLLAVLFGPWIGYYSFNKDDSNVSFEWFHAVGYCKERSVNPHSFKCINYDYASHENVCSIKNESSKKMRKIINCISNNKEYQKIQSNKLNEKHRICSSTKDSDFSKLNLFLDNEDYNNVSKHDYDKDENRFCRRSHRYYHYVQFDSKIVGIHPSNSTFDFIDCASPSDNTNASFRSCVYDVSKMFGLFYTDHTQTMVFNHSNQTSNGKNATKVYEASGKSIIRLMYDEGYGISGRLLIVAKNKEESNTITKYEIDSVVIDDDLLTLRNALLETAEINGGINETSVLKADIYLKIYEFCYGLEFIDDKFTIEKNMIENFKMRMRGNNNNINNNNNIENDNTDEDMVDVD